MLWCLIRSGLYFIKCDGDVHVERFGALCNVLRCICFMLLQPKCQRNPQ